MRIHSLPSRRYLLMLVGVIGLLVVDTVRAASAPHAIPGVDSYVCYYGSGRVADLAKFDLAIIAAQAYTAEEIAQIKVGGTIVVGYVSVGEYVGALQVGDGTGPISEAEGLTDGGYASFYLDDADHDHLPDQNGIYGSYYVNAADPAWQDYVITNLAAYVVDTKGCDGVFLDTVGIVDYDSPYAWTTSGMVNLISELRTAYPDEYLVQNRGFSVFAGSEPYVNAIMFESFTSTYNFNTDVYFKWAGANLALTTSEAININAIRDYPAATSVNVLALDYTESTNTTVYQSCFARAESFGFIPSVSDINLSSIYAVDLLVTDGNFLDWSDYEIIGTDSAGDVSAGDEVDFVSVWAINRRGNLHISYSTVSNIDFSTEAWRYAVYLDTDNNAATGFRGTDGSYGIGAEYMIEGAALHQYTGGGTDWSWGAGAALSYAYTSNRLEVEVSEASLGLSGDYAIRIMLDGKNTTTEDFAPNDKAGFEYTSSRIMIDGLFSDWFEEDVIGTDPSGDVSGGDHIDFTNAWARSEKGNLYISYSTVSNIDFSSGAWRYTVYLDTDNNTATGFRGFDGSYGLGADYMIEGSSLLQYAGNGTSFDWGNGDSLSYAYTSNQLEIAMSESELDLSGYYKVQIMFLGRNATTEDYAPDNKAGLEYITPPQPIGLFGMSFPEGLSMVLSWNTTAGQPYAVEYKNDLVADSEWLSYTNIVAPIDGEIAITNLIDQDTAFFRIVSP